VTQMFRLAGWSNEAAETASARIVAFETELAKFHMDVVESRNWDTNYNLMTLPELQTLTPTFDWSLYLPAQS